MAGLEPIIHATTHDVLDQPEGPRANRIVLEVDVQVFGLHRPIRRHGEFDATASGPTKWAHSWLGGWLKGEPLRQISRSERQRRQCRKTEAGPMRRPRGRAPWRAKCLRPGSRRKPMARERQIILKTNQCNILNEMGREENSPHSQAVGTRAGSFPRGRQRGRGLERAAG